MWRLEHRNVLSAFSVGNIKEILTSLTNEWLTFKQKRILSHLLVESEKITVTSFVSKFSKESGYSRSAVWYNLRPLKRMSLVNYGSNGSKMIIPIELTEIGRIISEKLEAR